jgi:hypothetical protein
MNEHKPEEKGLSESTLHTYRALEMDADHYAMRLATELAFKGYDPFREKLVPEVSLDQRLGILLMAGCILTLGWSALSEVEGCQDPLHPPPFVRYFTLILGFSDISENYIEKPHIRDIQRWAFARFSELTGTNAFFKPLAIFGQDKNARAHAERETEDLQNRLIAEENRLKPYRFVQIFDSD